MRRSEIDNMEDALVYYREQQEKAYKNYQETGMRRYANDEYLDGLLVSALTMALDKKDQVYAAAEKRSNEIDSYIRNKMIKETYTRKEVEELLRMTAWW